MKNQLLFLLAILLFATQLPARAQHKPDSVYKYIPDRVNKKAAALNAKAMDLLDDDVPGAIRLLQQAVQIDPNYEERLALHCRHVRDPKRLSARDREL